LWCTLIDRDGGQQPTVVKEVLAAFPPGTAAGPGQFRGQAVMAGHHARWDLAVTGDQAPLRPLRPAALYRAPLPRTKLEAVVPDGQVTGSLELDGRTVAVSGWRGTVGHNWGPEHADSWVWLHAAGFGAAPESWLELVLARIRVGPARSPWTAMGGDLHRPARRNPYRPARRTGRGRADPAPPGSARAHPDRRPRRLRVRHQPHARDRAATAA